MIMQNTVYRYSFNQHNGLSTDFKSKTNKAPILMVYLKYWFWLFVYRKIRKEYLSFLLKQYKEIEV